MASFQPCPPPPTKLGVYRPLSARAGAHVSPLALGGGNIGDKWSAQAGAMDKESSFKLLDAYFDKGGNFIDTANNYQEESSEQFIGEWAEKRGIRNQLFIATKYSTYYKGEDPAVKQGPFYVGNSAKTLYVSVEASLQKLRTHYIDLFYVHWWDFATSIEEVMDSLHNLVVQGKVIYLGISDTPAWIVSEANRYAREKGKTPFVVYQGQWSILDRSFERDIIPMARAHGMALAPWGVLGGGKLRTDAEEQRRKETGEKGRIMFSQPWERTETEVTVSRALEKIANEIGVKNITSVAIAYVLQKTTYVFPIIGGRKVEQLEQNMEALDITLSPEQVKFLESQVPFEPGFPHSMLGDGSHAPFFMNFAMHHQRVPVPQPLPPPTLTN